MFFIEFRLEITEKDINDKIYFVGGRRGLVVFILAWRPRGWWFESRSFLFFRRRHASGLVGGQIRSETKESFSMRSENEDEKVKTWRLSEGETAKM